MSDLLKAAIADAKAVRATALENAKAALQEAFAPKLQSMLATKLQQEVEDDLGDELPEEPMTAPVDSPVDTDVAVDGAEDFDAGFEGGDDLPVAGEEEAEEEFIEPAPEVDDELPVDEVLGQGHVDPVDQTDVFTEEKASPDYTKVTSGHKTVDPQGASKEFSAGPKKAEASATSGTLAAKTGPSATVKDMKNHSPKTADPQGPSNEFVTLQEDDVSDETLDQILKELESEVAMDDSGAEEEVPFVASSVEDDLDEEIDLSSLLESDDSCEDEGEEESEESEEDNKPEWLKENISLKKELQEYRNAVQYLRDRINEVNLLNAKLLYTNKLFKQANLTNEQKMKVIESFDLTKSVRETKLIYATLSESFNFGGKKAAPAKAPVRKVAAVKTITEGLASKSIASTKPTAAVITEGTEMANRFMKLAGIQKK